MNQNTESAVSTARAKSLTGDVYLLNTSDPQQCQKQAGVMSHGRECCTHDCDEGRDCPNSEAFASDPWWPHVVVVALVVVLAIYAFHPEIAALFLSFNK